MTVLGFDKIVLAIFSVAAGAAISAKDQVYIQHGFIPRFAYSCFVCAIVGNACLATDMTLHNNVAWIHETFERELSFLTYYIILNFGVGMLLNIILKSVVASRVRTYVKNLASLLFAAFLFYVLWELYNTNLISV
uniref:Uncharacterized protein n=1 Tax=Candidatus Kentrum sp. DK TaxID=2126562 RepID=A0A450TC96_9GAMM|nr:MAG: hypothetical protein BECKDK2373B_GA0170837_11372 [Candidatus Kentron sp. DK]